MPNHLTGYDVPVKLDQNENTAGVPKSVLDHLNDRLQEVSLHRYPTPRQPEIRSALSKLNVWPADGILVGNGTDELLLMLAFSVLEPGRRALYPSPSFYFYDQVVRVAGAEGIEVPLRNDLQYDVDALVRGVEALEPHVVFLCSPNNPTGSTLNEGEIRKVIESTTGLVVLDEAYWEFHGWNGRELLDEYPNLVLLRTFSKAFAMAGLRVGYLLARSELVEQFAKVQQPYPLNRLSSEAALIAIEQHDVFEKAARDTAVERERLYKRLERLEAVTVYPSRANFLAFRTQLGAQKTFEGLRERGVLVRDLGAHTLMRDTLRVGIGTPEENETFLRALNDLLEVAQYRE